MLNNISKTMPQKKVIEALKEKYSYLKDNFGVKKIGIFGSFAKGKEKEGSDIDGSIFPRSFPINIIGNSFSQPFGCYSLRDGVAPERAR